MGDKPIRVLGEIDAVIHIMNHGAGILRDDTSLEHVTTEIQQSKHHSQSSFHAMTI